MGQQGMVATSLWLLLAAVTAGTPPLESPRQWVADDADTGFVVQRHERGQTGPQGEVAEFVRIRAGTGTYVYLAAEAAPARILDDVELAVWVKSPRRGMQLFGRVVFPYAVDPTTGASASVLVPGALYDQPGNWQRLVVDQFPLGVQRQLRVLRARLQQPLDVRDAYLAEAVVNVYGGPGTTDVRLGAVELTGAVPPPDAALTAVRQAAHARDSAAIPDFARRRSSRLIVGGRPFFPRLIEHRGEPFELLQRLGFNAVYLDHSPTEGDRTAADRTGLWLVCPPPTEADAASGDFPRILGWFCGEDYLSHEHAADYLERIRRQDPHHRPLIAGVTHDQWRVSRELDIVLRLREPIGTSFELSHFGRWLEDVSFLVRPGTPVWASLQTELSSSLTEQVKGIVGHVGNVPRNLQSEQIRQLALAAVSAGARGLWYRSRTRLDEPGPAGELRRLTLELINHELLLIEPWVMGGQTLGSVQGQNAELHVVGLATERSRLLVPTYVQPLAQFVCRPVLGGNTLIIPGVPDSTNAYVLNRVGLKPIAGQRISGGLQIQLEPSNADALLLLTEDPLVITHINRTVSASRRRVVQLEQELAEQLLSEFETQASRRLLATAKRVDAWEAARSFLRQSRELTGGSDLDSAYQFAHQARRELGKLQADVWSEAVADWPDPLWQPTGAAFRLITLAPDRSPNEQAPVASQMNRLPGGDCEDLTSMINLGWRQHQTSPPDVQTYITLTSDRPHGGQRCLRIVARGTSKEAELSVVETGPVWVNSAPVTVQPGERIRVVGWIRIDETIRGNLDGCVISDSASGSELALRRNKTDGWQPFEMIRSVPCHDHLTVTVALHGLGEVWLDDLQVYVEPADVSPSSGRGDDLASRRRGRAE